MTTLPRAPLGRTGMQISRVGFGSWALGGGDWVSSWGPQDDELSIAAIRHAVESGVDWIDTAAVYGLGHAEQVVRRALAPYSEAERPLVFTKGGMVWDPQNRRAGSKRRGEDSVLRRQVDESLARLGVERIDLYFVHWPSDDVPLEQYWQTLVDLRAEGKLRAIGLSNHDVEAVARAEAIAHVDAVQPPFSAIQSEAAESLLPWCSEHGTGAVVYSPMGSGLLTGAFSRERVASLPEDDWRRRSPAFTERLEQNLATGDAIAAVAARHGVSQAAAAVAWTLGFPGVTGAIVGARTPEHVDGWIAAASLELDPEDYARIPGPTPGTR